MIFCNKCEIPMIVESIGIPCLTLDDEKRPYMIHMGDTNMCPICGIKVIAANPMPAYEYFQPDFKEQLQRFKDAGILIGGSIAD